MTERPLGIGILGAAGIAERAIVEPARELDGVRVIAIGARDPERARRWPIVSGSRIRRLRDGPEPSRRRPRLPSPAVDRAGAVGRAGAAGGKACAVREAAVGERHDRSEDRRGGGCRGQTCLRGISLPTARLHASAAGGARLGCARADPSRGVRLQHPPLRRAAGNIRLDGDLGGGSFMDVGCYAVDLMRAAWGEPAVVSAEAVV